MDEVTAFWVARAELVQAGVEHTSLRNSGVDGEERESPLYLYSVTEDIGDEID